MRKPKHTPAPWGRNIRPGRKYPVVFAGRNTHVAQVIPGNLPDEEVEANLDLVLAAPYLLDALQQCRDQFALYVQNHLAKSPADLEKAATNRQFVDLCDSAIAKAMGGEA